MTPTPLQHWWLPLCAAAELHDGQPLAVRHFDTALVLWRSGEEL